MTRVAGRLRESLSRGAAAYGRSIVALALNVPFILLALSRYPGSLTWSSLEGIYTVLVFLGYYVLLLLVVLGLVFMLACGWPRVILAGSAVSIGLVLFYFAIDGIVYRVLRMHVDGFWLQYLFTTFDGLGIGGGHIAAAVALLLGIAILEWALFRLARRVAAPRIWGAGLATVCVVAFVVSQAAHIVAYEVNDTRITALTTELPYYFPMTSHRNAVKYGEHLTMISDMQLSREDDTRATLRYPLAAVSCPPATGRQHANVVLLLLESWRGDALDSVVTPRLHRFAQDATVAGRHFSSGNSTPAGVFPVFYGLHSTYWAAVKANSARIDNPVLIDALRANDYAFGIFARSNFNRHKIKETVFRGIDVRESFQGRTEAEQDQDMTGQLLRFVRTERRPGQPFFAFAFYKSSHFPYQYPAGEAFFQPARELSVVRAADSDDPTPVLNDYRNSLRYLDGVIGQLLAELRSAGLLDSTIVIITGDHGEEFNDTRSNSWGHTGNFTGYQTLVPLIIHAPGKPPRRIGQVTSQVDIAPTLLQEALGCGWRTADYSNGHNLFGALPARRPIIISSYVTHALVLGDDVFVTWPTHVQQYRLDDLRRRTGAPAPDLLAQAFREMRVFYGSAADAPMPATGTSAAPASVPAGHDG
jgi:uncharacterized protein